MNGGMALNEFVQFAQKAVKAITKIMPFPISLTDVDGVIVGTSDPKRIGTIHTPSKQVIRQNKLVFFDESRNNLGENVLPGAAVPLHFDYETVGVLGIIGDPKEVEPYVLLVKNYIEMMWHDTEYQKQLTLELSHMETFIQYLLFTPQLDDEKIDEYCKMMDIPKHKTRYCIIVEFGDSLSANIKRTVTPDEFKSRLIHLMKSVFDAKDDICSFLNTERMVLCKTCYGLTEYVNHMKKFEQNSEQFIHQLKNMAIEPSQIAVGPLVSSMDRLADSYRKAEVLVQFAKKHPYGERSLSCMDPSLLAELFYHDTVQLDDSLELLLQPLKKDPAHAELIGNFITYMECNMNISEAAEQLYIHRNTLLYRLNKLHKLTGIPYKQFKLASMLYYYLVKNRVG